MMPRLVLYVRHALLGAALMLPMGMMVMGMRQAQAQIQTPPQTSPHTTSLDAQTRQARVQRQQLQADIQALHQTITASENVRQEVVLQLRQLERAISAQVRKLTELTVQQRQLAREVQTLTRQITAQKQALTARQDALGKQVQARYIQNPAALFTPYGTPQAATAFWATLLSGQTPHAIGRELTYLAYVSHAQADSLRSVQQSLAALAQAETDLRTRQQTQAALQAQVAQQKKNLEGDYAQREQVLIGINAQLREQRSQIDTLKRDEQRLNTLMQGLEAAVKKQAQQTAKQAAKQLEQAKQAEQTRAAQATPSPAARPADATPTPTPALSGLQKNLPRPVQGRVQGRFGMERPDGGVWRGIVLLAKEGEPVRAIAPGQVVYADWLKGFGNMIIVDHGQAYMSIYAYNQSLLKSLGDTVTAHEALATVGATGGQVQAGLYFEIRHQGSPVNPLLWLQP